MFLIRVPLEWGRRVGTALRIQETERSIRISKGTWAGWGSGRQIQIPNALQDSQVPVRKSQDPRHQGQQVWDSPRFGSVSGSLKFNYLCSIHRARHWGGSETWLMDWTGRANWVLVSVPFEGCGSSSRQVKKWDPRGGLRSNHAVPFYVMLRTLDSCWKTMSLMMDLKGGTCPDLHFVSGWKRAFLSGFLRSLAVTGREEGVPKPTTQHSSSLQPAARKLSSHSS